MLTVVLLLSAAITIPHLLIKHLQYEHQIKMHRSVSWMLYSVLKEKDYKLRCADEHIKGLQLEISGSHRISKRFTK